MPLFLGYAIAFLGVFIAYKICKGKPKKRKYMVWGIALMVPISPALSFAIGLTNANISNNAWAGLLMFIIFPILFITGLVMLLVGIFKKDET